MSGLVNIAKADHPRRLKLDSLRGPQQAVQGSSFFMLALAASYFPLAS